MLTDWQVEPVNVAIDAATFTSATSTVSPMKALRFSTNSLLTLTAKMRSAARISRAMTFQTVTKPETESDAMRKASRRMARLRRSPQLRRRNALRAAGPLWRTASWVSPSLRAD